MDDRLLQLMEEIDEHLKEEKGDLTFFCTEFGEEFEDNYLDLMRFADIATLLPTLVKPAMKLNQAATSGEFLNYIEEGAEFAENLSARQKEQVKTIVTRMKEDWDQLAQITPVKEELPKALESEDESEDAETDVEGFLDELQILPRIIAYFIFALYSYIDVYSMHLVQFLMAISNVEEFYRLLTQFKVGQNPHHRIKEILKGTDAKNLSDPLEHLLEAGHWETHQKAFADLIGLRNHVAHRKPLTTPQEFQKKFPQFSKRAKQEAEKLQEKVQSVIPQETLPSSFSALFLDLFSGDLVENFFMIRQLATSCYRYLALIDNLVVNWIASHPDMDGISESEGVD